MPPLVSIIIPMYNQAKELELALASLKKQTYQNIEIIVETDEKHEGAPVMRNRGFVKSTGAYVIFWDADIVGEPEMIAKMVNKLDQNPDKDFVYCNYYFGYKKMPAQEFNLSALQKNNYIHSTSLVRREAVIKWDEALKRFQDWDFWLTLSENGKQGIWLDEYLFKIISKGTMSSWLPSFAYQKPWKWLPGIKNRVKKYEIAKNIIYKKHSI